VRASTTVAAVTLSTLPLLPSLLALLPKRAEQAILRSIKAHSLGRRAYNTLCWHPHSFGRRQALRPWLRSLVTTSCVHVAADGRATATPREALPPRRGVRIVAVSDTHNLHGDLQNVPDGDVLIHCGDGLRRGGDEEGVRALGQWLASQPHAVKVVTGGNHDATLERLSRDRVAELLGSGVNFVANAGLEINGIRIFVSPYSNANSARSPNRAFQGDDVLDELRATLPAFAKDGLDVFVSHGPPAGILDKGAGSDALAELVGETAPRYHIFGHQHNCFGTIVKGRTCFVNASSTDGLFALCKPPLVVDVVADASAMAPSESFFDVDYVRGRLALVS
jgi:Icc-related predicted phosphoesterase